MANKSEVKKVHYEFRGFDIDWNGEGVYVLTETPNYSKYFRLTSIEQVEKTFKRGKILRFV